MAEQETINQPWFLRGNWRPIQQERTETQLVVHGNIPSDLRGVYLRTGPNPKSGTGEHWFLGDGMVHGIRLSDGKAQWYKNRFLQTPDPADSLRNSSAPQSARELGRRQSAAITIAANFRRALASAMMRGIGA